MTRPTVAAIVAEIRTAHEQLSGMVEAGAFDKSGWDVNIDMSLLAVKLDTWATALELVGVGG